MSNRRIGFSTGCINEGNYQQGIDLLKNMEIKLVEVSSLREKELPVFLGELNKIDFSTFEYVSFHAPSRLMLYNETELVEALKPILEKGWPIIVHPDIITDFKLWQTFGESLCIENMDIRKPIGRTYKDLIKLFDILPDASFCFDIAHAKQIDPTMFEARMMINHFKSRIKQIHLSDVNSKSKHEALNYESYISYSRLSPLIPTEIPIIIESPTRDHKLNSTLQNAEFVLEDAILA